MTRGLRTGPRAGRQCGYVHADHHQSGRRRPSRRHQAVRRGHRRRDLDLRIAARRGGRVPRPERRRQDHAPSTCCSACPARTPAPSRSSAARRPRRSPRAGSPPCCRPAGCSRTCTVGETVAMTAALLPAHPAGRRGARTGRHRRHRGPRWSGKCSGGQQQRLRFAHGAAARPGADGARRADHRHGRRGAARLLERHPRRTPGPAAPSSSPPTTWRRRTRTPTGSSWSARDASSPTAPPPRSRPWPPAGRCGPPCPAPTRSRWRRCPASTPRRCAATACCCTPSDSDAVARLPAHRAHAARDLEITSRNLEDAFLALTTDETGADR